MATGHSGIYVLAAKLGTPPRILAWLHALKYVHQTAHWMVDGPSAHADHLLLQRLYTTVEAEIDAAGEKVVGAGLATDGQGWVHVLAGDIKAIIGVAIGEPDLLVRSSRMEDAFQVELEAAINAWTHAGGNAGIDNWLRALADAHQTHQYLLRQRLRGG